MATLALKTPLTQDESSYYTQLFQQLDPESLGVVTGESVRPLFASSGVSPQILSQVWSLVDTNNKGFLNFNEFSAALRVIANIQRYPNTQITSALYDNPAPQLPILRSVGNGDAQAARVATPLAVNNTNSSFQQTTGGNMSVPSPVQSQIPYPPQGDVSRFSELFDRSSNGSKTLPGDKAKDIFLKAKLSNQALGQIWALCDRSQSGALDKTEFIMAMYLIQLSIANHPSVRNLPPHYLPQQLWDAVTAAQIAGSPAAAGQASLSDGTGVVRNRPSSMARINSGTFNNAADDWSLSFEKKKQFDVIFDSLDKSHQGKLNSQILVPFFLSSKLSQDTLATVWDLADIHNNAEFTKVEFAIAMFLIQKKNSGVDLPDVIPNELLASPALGLVPEAQQAQVQQPQIQQNQAPYTIPSRSTKPSYANVALGQPQTQTQTVQHTGTSSLNDLLTINMNNNNNNGGAASGVNTNNTGPIATSTTTGIPDHSVKRFTPTSHFGQSIIKEEPVGATSVPQYSNSPIPQPAATINQPAAKATPSPSNIPQVPNFASLNLRSPSSVGSPGMGNTTLNTTQFQGSGGMPQNSNLYNDAEASNQLSAATTDLANLSNQVNSLTKQATLQNEKKAKTLQELKRLTDLKLSIQNKLTTLKASHEQNTRETEQMERSLATTRTETESLQQQLRVVEANHHAMEAKMNELNSQLQEAQQTNAQLKEQIAKLNEQTAALETQLAERQQLVKQETAMAGVNSKQLEVNEITVKSLTDEISGLEEKLNIFKAKNKELDDYQQTIQNKHAHLQSRYEELSSQETQLHERQQQLNERTKQIEEQEGLYRENVTRLQTLFDELSQRKEEFDKADQELQNQYLQYADRVQDLSDRQLKLAMGTLPEDAEDIVEQNKLRELQSESGGETHPETELADKAVALPVATGQDKANVPPTSAPTLPSSVTDAVGTTVTSGAVRSPENQVSEDRFEGNLDEYGVPRTGSLSSSVANNAPQSTRANTNISTSSLPSNEGDNLDASLSGTAEEDEKSQPPASSTADIPGKFSAYSDSDFESALPSPVVPVGAEGETGSRSEDHANVGSATFTSGPSPLEREITPSPSPAAEDNSSVSSEEGKIERVPAVEKQGEANAENNTPENVELQPVDKKMEEPASALATTGSGKPSAIDEEFPPIRELNISEDESSSSTEDDLYQDTRQEVSPVAPKILPPTMASDGNAAGVTHTTEQPDQSLAVPPTDNEKDEFDNEFSGLEQAALEEGEDEAHPEQLEKTGIATTPSLGATPREHQPEVFSGSPRTNLNAELQENVFTEAIPVQEPTQFSAQQPQNQQEVTNDEWDEIFAGFGNAKHPEQSQPQGVSEVSPESPVTPAAPAVATTTDIEQPTPLSGHLQQPQSLPVDRSFAITPKGLAIEELSGMGFSHDEAVKALERCNWDLDAATNYLLDAA